MSNADIRGRFIWHELMTTDPEAAGAFYTNVIPWKTQPSGMPSYTLWMSGKNQAGGLMALPHAEAGTPPQWIIYVGTPDVDSSAEAARRLGGKVLKPPADIPNVGRFAVLSDPQGAAFAIFTPKPGSGDGASTAGAVGDFTWHELATTDLDGALTFYTDLFGWSKGAAHDMGPMGVYQLISHRGQDVGGIYKARDASTPPSWLSYTRVADAAKAASAVKANGGRVLNGPMEVPGGSWIVMALDPQGGAFAVVEAPKAAKAEAPSAQKKPAEAAKPAQPSPAGKPPSAPAAVPPAKAAPAASAGKAEAASQSRTSAPPAAAATSSAAGSRTRAPAKRPSAKKAGAKKTAAARKTGGRKTAAKKAGSRKTGAKSSSRRSKTRKRSAVKRAASVRGRKGRGKSARRAPGRSTRRASRKRK
ncbi:MAG TPA: VOC family protein [Steroidobacteraceae bacterium]|nr:VOC family protein [Steroidobacteraceae bacterium]